MVGKERGFGLAVRRGEERGGLLAERALQGACVRCDVCVSGEYELITAHSLSFIAFSWWGRWIH